MLIPNMNIVVFRNMVPVNFPKNVNDPLNAIWRPISPNVRPLLVRMFGTIFAIASPCFRYVIFFVTLIPRTCTVAFRCGSERIGNPSYGQNTDTTECIMGDAGSFDELIRGATVTVWNEGNDETMGGLLHRSTACCVASNHFE
jgi:hypothetical protein